MDTLAAEHRFSQSFKRKSCLRDTEQESRVLQARNPHAFRTVETRTAGGQLKVEANNEQLIIGQPANQISITSLSRKYLIITPTDGIDINIIVNQQGSRAKNF